MTIASEANSTRARAAVKASRDAERMTIQSIMSTPIGRKWMWDTLSTANIFGDAENLDHASLAHSAGKRSLGLNLLRAVTRHTPALYITMTQENTGLTLEDQADD